ncbi:MAG: hypothetical protein H0W72_07645, partial [Planctomycetes bacterium]|nr:hypothetical protein [Planctomycetota bacterium]
MLNAQDLIRDGKLLPEAIEHAHADPGELVKALSGAGDGPSFAALALVAGLCGVQQALPALLAGLSREDHGGKAAAWALARLDSERAVIDAIAGGGLDVRENGYYSLSVRAALGKASPQVATAMAERVAAEIARAKQKMTGLGEHALRPLAILGAPGTDALIQQVLEADPYTDKFELQRLRKAVADGSRDQDSQRELAGPWVALFADHVYA